MKQINRIAVLTSGGDAPGMNAAVRAVVRAGAYHDMHIYGIKRGYQGLIEGDVIRLERNDVGNIIHRGGTFLHTARSKDFMTKEGRERAYETLQAHDIDGLVVIGGNGTYTGAKVFGEEFDFPIIGLPGTIDNDIYGTDYTIGFDTAINTAIDAVDKIRDTADSHNRVFFIEVMGRHSGYIALYTGIGSGSSAILIPETETSIDEIASMLRKGTKRNKLFSLVIVAEGNQNGDAFEIAEKLKKIYSEPDIRVTVIGHLQRGGSPSCMDRVLATRLGASAVRALLDGKRNEALGIINNHVVYTSFEEAITKHHVPDQELIDMAHMLSL